MGIQALNRKSALLCNQDRLIEITISYWDWTLDAPTGKFLESPLWDPVDGFGGNGPFVELPRTGGPAGSFPIAGRTGGGCITDGPFKNMTVRIGPNGDLKGNPRCLTRDFSPSYAAQNCDKTVLDKVIAQPNYDLMDRTMEGAIGFSPPNVHGGGHFSIGGTLGIMGDFAVSVGGALNGRFIGAKRASNAT